MDESQDQQEGGIGVVDVEEQEVEIEEQEYVDVCLSVGKGMMKVHL